jgi:hypothetical protein
MQQARRGSAALFVLAISGHISYDVTGLRAGAGRADGTSGWTNMSVAEYAHRTMRASPVLAGITELRRHAMAGEPACAREALQGSPGEPC